MTPRDKLVYVKDGADLSEAKRPINQHRLERVMVVNDAFELRGLITVRISEIDFAPAGLKDSQGKLRVGAAVGVGADNEDVLRGESRRRRHRGRYRAALRACWTVKW